MVELEARLQDACDSATQWKEAAERVAAEKSQAEAALGAAQLAAGAEARQAEAAAADLQESSARQAVRSSSSLTSRCRLCVLRCWHHVDIPSFCGWLESCASECHLLQDSGLPLSCTCVI